MSEKVYCKNCDWHLGHYAEIECDIFRSCKRTNLDHKGNVFITWHFATCKDIVDKINEFIKKLYHDAVEKESGGLPFPAIPLPPGFPINIQPPHAQGDYFDCLTEEMEKFLNKILQDCMTNINFNCMFFKPIEEIEDGNKA